MQKRKEQGRKEGRNIEKNRSKREQSRAGRQELNIRGQQMRFQQNVHISQNILLCCINYTYSILHKHFTTQNVYDIDFFKKKPCWQYSVFLLGKKNTAVSHESLGIEDMHLCCLLPVIVTQRVNMFHPSGSSRVQPFSQTSTPSRPYTFTYATREMHNNSPLYLDRKIEAGELISFNSVQDQYIFSTVLFEMSPSN